MTTRPFSAAVRGPRWMPRPIRPRTRRSPPHSRDRDGRRALATESFRGVGAWRGNVMEPRVSPDRDGVLDPLRVAALADRPSRRHRVRPDAQRDRRDASPGHRRRAHGRAGVRAAAIVRRARRRGGGHADLSLAPRLGRPPRRGAVSRGPRPAVSAGPRALRLRRARLPGSDVACWDRLRGGSVHRDRRCGERRDARLVRACGASRDRAALRGTRGPGTRDLPDRRPRVLPAPAHPHRGTARRDRGGGGHPAVLLGVRRVWAIARCRCPRCLSGRVWRGMFTMNEPCPVFGMPFERETGVWTGAMVASYALGIPVLALLVLAVWLGTGWDIVLALVVPDVLFLAVVPFIWRYSRVVWLHLDWLTDPVPST